MALEITVLRVLARIARARPARGLDPQDQGHGDPAGAHRADDARAVGPAVPARFRGRSLAWGARRAGVRRAVAAQYLNFRKVSIYGGSNEIQRNIVSQMILGLCCRHMDFDYTEEQQLLKDSVGKFLEKNYSFETRKQIIASRAGYSPTAWEGLAASACSACRCRRTSTDSAAAASRR